MHPAISLNLDCGVDLEVAGALTVAVIGPSRRGKSVLAGLLAGGDPGLFPQSHSSFQAHTSGTHIVEVPRGGAAALRIIDTEGLSHIGRSRGRREAMVRQFLVSTYLTSSWIVWLDSEVLSTGFFTMMWLVHDYVVDVLKIKDFAGDRLPRLMYVRTQETEVQQREYCDKFDDFGSFFDQVLSTHEDADILRQMFAPGGLHGHALPIWTGEDLDAFTARRFWDGQHESPFKAAVGGLRDRLQLGLEAAGEPSASGPPLLALAALEQHLPRIARLEAFDPRDAEAAKVSRMRQHLRAKYGRVAGSSGVPGAAGMARVASTVELLNIFEPQDRDLRRHGGRLDNAVWAKLEEHCTAMRLDSTVAAADLEVNAVLDRFRGIADTFAVAAAEFANEVGPLSERQILRAAIHEWRLDPGEAATALAARLKEAEARFLSASQLTEQEMRRLNMHERLRWRIEECIMRLRGKVAAEMRLLPDEASDAQQASIPTVVWKLGEWRWRDAPWDGKSRAAKPREYALWTDGSGAVLYEERWQPRSPVSVDDGGLGGATGYWVGVPVERFEHAAAPLPALRAPASAA